MEALVYQLSSAASNATRPLLMDMRSHNDNVEMFSLVASRF